MTTPCLPIRSRWPGTLPALLLVTTAMVGCASSGEGVDRAVTLVFDVHNDLAPVADVVVWVNPIWGDRADRIEVGVVRGSSTGEFRITVPAGRYTLSADYLFGTTRTVQPIPAGRRAWIRPTRRFDITPRTRRVEWLIGRRSLAVNEGEGG